MHYLEKWFHFLHPLQATSPPLLMCHCYVHVMREDVVILRVALFAVEAEEQVCVPHAPDHEAGA